MRDLRVLNPPESAARIILEDVSWRTYESLLSDYDGRPGVRLNYESNQLRHRALSSSSRSTRRIAIRRCWPARSKEQRSRTASEEISDNEMLVQERQSMVRRNRLHTDRGDM